MVENAPKLRSLSVVILAERHNPSILNPDFLNINGIIPKEPKEEWRTVETVTTPGLSISRYRNGTQLVADPERLAVSQDLDEQFTEHNGSNIYGIATRYVDLLPHIPYRKLGLNCLVSIIREDPLGWITKRFLKADYSPDAGLYMMPKFIIKSEKNMLNLNFSHRKTPQGNEVVIDCNVHHNGPFDPKSLCQEIEKWPIHQKNIKNRIDGLLWADEQ